MLEPMEEPIPINITEKLARELASYIDRLPQCIFLTEKTYDRR